MPIMPATSQRQQRRCRAAGSPRRARRAAGTARRCRARPRRRSGRARRRAAGGRAGTGATTRRRLARRTARSAGRSGASPGENECRPRSDTATAATPRGHAVFGATPAVARDDLGCRREGSEPAPEETAAAEALVADTARLAARLAFAIAQHRGAGPLRARRGARRGGLPARGRRSRPAPAPLRAARAGAPAVPRRRRRCARASGWRCGTTRTTRT